MSISKAELLALIRDDHAALEAIVAGLSDGVLETPGPGGGWPVKDHLSTWRRGSG